MLEKDLKKTVWDYLQYKTNLGELYADRLNSGEAIVVAGQSRRRIKLCREGTADFYILKLKIAQEWKECRVIFLELKSAKGRSSPAQRAFKILVESQGAEFHIFRSIEELEVILK